MIYFCCDERRREAVRSQDEWNGIDFLEVSDTQLQLIVHFIHSFGLVTDADKIALDPDNFRVEGGERIRGVSVVGAELREGANNVILLTLDKAGDFSPYRLRLVNLPTDNPEKKFDPRLSSVDFSFKVECPSEFDCRPQRVCPVEPPRQPEINYLAKDYASFRQLMLDRLAALVPQWKERSPADVGVALVELLAYVGDYLSYQQDAVATEAYLGTCRRRTSARRHARLVDYRMHDGSNARTWVHLHVDEDVIRQSDAPVLPVKTILTTRIEGQHDARLTDERLMDKAGAVFETMHAIDELRQAHNEIKFYTWGDQRCCLPKGATRAYLLDNFDKDNPDDKSNRLRLKRGDVLIFEERLGPSTGHEEDADATHRHAVRLTFVLPQATSSDDGLQRDVLAPLTDPLNGQSYVEIHWHDEDALPFPLCISAISEQGKTLENVSVARGNTVLADHGLTVRPEMLDPVPASKLSLSAAPSDDRCAETPRRPMPARFRPVLKLGPLTQAAPLPDVNSSATSALHWSMRDVLPSIRLLRDVWQVRSDLLGSGPTDTHFVVETEADGTATLRFGDDLHGLRPNPGDKFTATYRVGSGTAGNIGADSLAHVVTGVRGIAAVRNPLPARGGTEPETIAELRQRAPFAFRRQERAVTPGDYEEVALRHGGVQRAAATFRWTGSWHTVFVTADRLDGLPVDQPFEDSLRRHLERFRLAGYDLKVDAPRDVALEIKMVVCAKPDYFRSDLKAALLQVFSNRTLPDGRSGVFHPDNFTFGQPVYLSRLYAAAQAVPGVASVAIPKFRRLGTKDKTARQTGKLELGRLEIARLDNDPNFREHGVLEIRIEGGK